MHNPQQLAVEALTRMLGDELLKACWAFQKKEIPPHHQDQFIDEFLKRRQQLDHAIHWVKAQPFCETRLGE